MEWFKIVLIYLFENCLVFVVVKIGVFCLGGFIIILMLNINL